MATKKSKKPNKLTKQRREILDLLNQGHMIEIDKSNMPSICGLSIHPHRFFLTENRYVTRKDKNKSVETKGNGFVISEKGKKYIELNPSLEKNSLILRIKENSKQTANYQIDKIKLYVLSVVKHITKRSWESVQNDSWLKNQLDTIVNQLSKDNRIVKSIMNEFSLGLLSDIQNDIEYLKFGEYRDEEGYTCTGASKQSIGFKKTKGLVIAELNIKAEHNNSIKQTVYTGQSESQNKNMKLSLGSPFSLFLIIVTLIFLWVAFF